jgi:hypothetical protein
LAGFFVYSERKLLTGFTRAARTAWIPAFTIATPTASSDFNYFLSFAPG